MDTNSKAAVSAGVLFIVATVASIVGTTLSKSLLADPAYLGKLSANSNLISAGALIELIAAGACAGIAIALYPVLRQWSPGLALGSVVFRTIEAIMYSVAAVSLLSVLELSQQFETAVSADRGAIQAAASALLAVRDQVIVPGVLAFSLGALMYYYIFYQSRLIPRWLAGWGIVGIVLAMVACFVALFTRNPLMNYAIVMLPIGVQEMVLAVWLIAKGFSPAVLQSEPTSRVRAALAAG